MDTQEKIEKFCDELYSLLRAKNQRYGDSALSPLQVFQKGKIQPSLSSRIDDKLSRIKNSDGLRKNDIIDLMGYLVLLCIDNNWIDLQDLID